METVVLSLKWGYWIWVDGYQVGINYLFVQLKFSRFALAAVSVDGFHSTKVEELERLQLSLLRWLREETAKSANLDFTISSCRQSFSPRTYLVKAPHFGCRRFNGMEKRTKPTRNCTVCNSPRFSFSRLSVCCFHLIKRHRNFRMSYTTKQPHDLWWTLDIFSLWRASDVHTTLTKLHSSDIECESMGNLLLHRFWCGFYGAIHCSASRRSTNSDWFLFRCPSLHFNRNRKMTRRRRWR